VAVGQAFMQRRGGGDEKILPVTSAHRVPEGLSEAVGYAMWAQPNPTAWSGCDKCAWRPSAPWVNRLRTGPGFSRGQDLTHKLGRGSVK
jgi:hypothetical protein